MVDSEPAAEKGTDVRANRRVHRATEWRLGATRAAACGTGASVGGPQGCSGDDGAEAAGPEESERRSGRRTIGAYRVPPFLRAGAHVLCTVPGVPRVLARRSRSPSTKAVTSGAGGPPGRSPIIARAGSGRRAVLTSAESSTACREEASTPRPTLAVTFTRRPRVSGRLAHRPGCRRFSDHSRPPSRDALASSGRHATERQTRNRRVS